MSATNLLESAPDELVRLVEGWGHAGYRGRQLAAWIYRKGVTQFEEMSNLPKSLRARLAEEAVVAVPEAAARAHSRDGSRKLGLRLADGRVIHTVLMPDRARLTLCLSTQVGCGFACAFCCTGTMGLVRNLTAGEIVGQVLAAHAALTPAERITHVVFMGMGEPLANYAATVKAARMLVARDGFGFAPRRVTISTVGLVQGIERLAREKLGVGLAISLHAATDELRNQLMTVNRGWGIEDLLSACRRFPLRPRQRITFEYVLLDGVNDRERDARQLARRLTGLRAKVNLIPFNKWGDSRFQRPPPERIRAFQETLLASSVVATVRWSKGEDVGAACGQLATEDRGRRGDTVAASA